MALVEKTFFVFIYLVKGVFKILGINYITVFIKTVWIKTKRLGYRLSKATSGLDAKYMYELPCSDKNGSILLVRLKGFHDNISLTNNSFVTNQNKILYVILNIK